jgi:hypothetical protein
MSDTPDDEVQAAFPDRYRDGMTLRDYFAAQAMHGLIASPRGLHGKNVITDVDYAQAAYLIADAMMKAREA